MGRIEAKGKWKGARCVKPGRVNWRQWQDTLRAQGDCGLGTKNMVCG
jgi:hypothetical protein